MRFCDFFTEYKIGLKEIKKKSSWKESPCYMKISLIIIFICVLLAALLSILILLFNVEIPKILFYILYGAVVVIFIICELISSSLKNLKETLYNYSRIYSYNRMNMLKSIFQKYNLDISNSITIDLLIQEAKEAQIENDPFNIKNKPSKILQVAIIPIITYVATKIAETFTIDNLIYIALLAIIIIFCIIVFYIALFPVIKGIIYLDNSKYDNLIYDLRQLKIFYK